MLKEKEENPNGLYRKYTISKVDGSEIDPSAEFFVLRLDENGEPNHVVSSIVAIRAYAHSISEWNPTLAKDINDKYNITDIDRFSNREKIKFETEFAVAPILDEYALENDEYEPYYTTEGDRNNDPMWSIWNNFTIIENKVKDFDVEDSYEDHEVIVQRSSDGKFFMGSYTYSPYNGCDDFSTTLVEVFPDIEIVTVYK